MKFRPCIDLHQGKVKQIVGSSFQNNMITNFVASKSPGWYADLYRQHNLHQGHVVMLGAGNENAALEAVTAYPNAMQVGGGINVHNAQFWLDHGAAAVIVTSAIFHEQKIHYPYLEQLAKALGPQNIILDLSCSKTDGTEYWIYFQGWQKRSTEILTADLLHSLADYCGGFLVHSIANEGQFLGLDLDLVTLLAHGPKIPITYAGGLSSQKDLADLEQVGGGKIDFTIGSALDIFGGDGFCFETLAQKYGGK